MSESLEKMLIEDNRRMRQAGCALAEASLRVIKEYDGLHRLSLAVAEWSKAIASEGGRGDENYALIPREPTQEDVERVALRLHLLLGHRGYVVLAEREPFTSMPEPWQEDFKAMSELLWAAIVGEGTRGGTDET